MNLSRFFLGLALLEIALLAFKFTTDPLAGSNLAATFAETIGSVTGGLLWGLIVWAPIRLIRGSDKAPDIRSFTLYSAAIIVALFIIFRFFAGTPLDNSDRIEFASGFEKTCFSSQRKSEENASLNDSQLREYCSCISSSFSIELTEEQIKYVGVNKVIPASLEKKLQNISVNCSQQLRQNWESDSK